MTSLDYNFFCGTDSIHQSLTTSPSLWTLYLEGPLCDDSMATISKWLLLVATCETVRFLRTMITWNVTSRFISFYDKWVTFVCENVQQHIWWFCFCVTVLNNLGWHGMRLTNVAVFRNVMLFLFICEVCCRNLCTISLKGRSIWYAVLLLWEQRGHCGCERKNLHLNHGCKKRFFGLNFFVNTLQRFFYFFIVGQKF